MKTPMRIVAVALVATAFAIVNGCHADHDSTPPTAAMDAVPAVVSRTITLNATASDDVALQRVNFELDGTAISTQNSPPFTLTWNSGAVADGTHTLNVAAYDTSGNVTRTPVQTFTVRNVISYAVSATGAGETPVVPTTATGTGTITINLATGAVGGSVTAAGFTSTLAHIHDGYAGTNGPVIVNFEKDAADPNKWVPTAGGALTAAQVDKLLTGGLYFNIHSAAFPGGQVRGQLLPSNVAVYYADISTLEEVPTSNLLGRGRGAVTVNTDTRVAYIHLTTQQVTGATLAHLHRGVAGVNGGIAVGLAQDTANANHWFVNAAQLSQADYDLLRTANTYLNVHTPANPAGEVRGQVVPPGYLVVVSRITGEQEAPTPRLAAAKGSAALTVNTATGAADIHFNVTGADDSILAHIHSGYAGSNGPVIIPLEKDPAAATHWRSNGATMTQPQIDALLDGGLYANVHTPAFPAGFVRGQMLPSGTQLVIATLTAAQEPTSTGSAATGRASVTVNTNAKRVTLFLNNTGLDAATLAHIHVGARGTNGPVSVNLTKNATTPSQWSTVQAALTDQQLADYRAGNWYVNVHSAAFPGGEIRGQVELPGVVPLSFGDIQAGVFNGSCATSGCHAGASPAAGLSLETANSYAALVGQTSSEVPSLLRVRPGDAPASYLIRKLAGTPGIVGAQMPPSGALPAETIDRIRAWINAGALGGSASASTDTTPPTVTVGSVPATITGTVTLTATASDNVGVATVRWRVNGGVVGSATTAPYTFAWDSTTVTNGAVTIDAQALDAAGNVATSVPTTATVSNAGGVTAFTFTEVQSQVFNVSCAVSGCHAGATPQAGMNLEAPAYSRIVNVASSEVPSLFRIKPGDSANSYMVQKLQGTAAVGGQMPLGGPFLSAATIAKIKAWIDAGAPNN